MRKTTGLISLLALAGFTPVSSWAIDASSYDSDEEIKYRFVASEGPSVRRRDGAVVYKNKPRGYVDNEPMLEIVYADRPKEPVHVDVIHYKPEEDIGVVSNTRRKKLVGEDKIFETIHTDIVKARCLLLGEDCDQTPEYKARRDSLYPPVEAPREELDVRTSRSNARKREYMKNYY